MRQAPIRARFCEARPALWQSYSDGAREFDEAEASAPCQVVTRVVLECTIGVVTETDEWLPPPDSMLDESCLADLGIEQGETVTGTADGVLKLEGSRATGPPPSPRAE